MSHLFGTAQRGVDDRQAAGQHRRSLLGLTSWQQHCLLVTDFQKHYGVSLPEAEQTQKTDLDSIVEHHRFIRRPEDNTSEGWEVRLAQKYYAKLFKEYAVIDLSHYKSGLYGLRWRTKAEVVEGRGQFSCGCKGCDKRQQLASYELPFSYKEQGEQRQALVKVRLCPEHVLQLTYRKTRAVLKQQAREQEELEQAQQQQDAAGSQPSPEQQQTADLQREQTRLPHADYREHGNDHRKKRRRRSAKASLGDHQSAGWSPDAQHGKHATSRPASEPVEAVDDLLANTVAQWQEASFES